MRLGQAAKIWRDDKLQGNDVFADEIVDQFAQTAVLVSVLTPRYLNSEWCTREVREFCKRAERSGGVVVDNKARVFKVLKAPVDTQESLPAVMKNVLGYEFFTLEDGAPLELDPAYGEKFAQDYNRKVGKLAWDIAQLLKKLEAVTAPANKVATRTPRPKRPSIWPNVVMTARRPEKSWKAIYDAMAIPSCRISSCRGMRRTMSRPWSASWRAASSPSIWWARAMAPCPMAPAKNR